MMLACEIWYEDNNIMLGSIYREGYGAELRCYAKLKMDRICTLNV
jgi:hypothetical protein